MASDELIAELDCRADEVGTNPGLWPGLAIYRFTAPSPPRRVEVRGLALGIVAQGRKAATYGGRRSSHDRFTYVVVGGPCEFHGEVLDASADVPCLAMLLHLDPSMVRNTSALMHSRPTPPAPGGTPPQSCVVSSLDDELTSAITRFLRSLGAETDRRVLAPLYLQEVVYRILQRDRSARVQMFASTPSLHDPVAEAVSYIHTHIADPLTVRALARHVSLSPSAFSRLFRDVTGSPPYRFVKNARLNRGRELMSERRLTVSEVATRVGYSSTSHFIKEFRARFGTTPGSYVGRVTP